MIEKKPFVNYTLDEDKKEEEKLSKFIFDTLANAEDILKNLNKNIQKKVNITKHKLKHKDNIYLVKWKKLNNKISFSCSVSKLGIEEYNKRNKWAKLKYDNHWVNLTNTQKLKYKKDK